MIPGFNVKVEPGDCCPPIGVPFDPANNYDVDVYPYVRVLKRGNRFTVIGWDAREPFDVIRAARTVLERQAKILDELNLPEPEPYNKVKGMPMPGQPDHPVNREWNKGVELAEKQRATAETAEPAEPAPGPEPA